MDDDLNLYAAGPDETNGGEEEQKPKPVKRRAAPKKPKPKLTIEHLQKPGGLQEVFENFPKWFHDGYRGKGHEVRDLRRLLELYQRWHPRVFPYGSYNQFETALEKMSGTYALKDHLRKMREDLVNIVDPPSAQPDEDQQQQDQDAQQEQQQNQQQQQSCGDEPAGQNGGGDGAYDGMDDDDEFLNLQKQDFEAQMDAAEEAVPEVFEDFGDHNPAAVAPAAQTGPTRAAGNTNTAKRTMRDWSDDDDADDDEPLRHNQQQQQRTVSQPTAAAPPAAAADDAFMDELLDDMLEDEQLVQQGAPAAEPVSAHEAQPTGPTNAQNASDLENDLSVDADAELEKELGRKPKRSRLQRTAALEDSSSSEGEEMQDAPSAAAGPLTAVPMEAAAMPEQYHAQQLEGSGAKDDPPADSQQVATAAASQPQQQRARQLQLAEDDDDDSDVESSQAAAAEAAAGPSQGQDTGVPGTEAGGATQVDDGEVHFAPLVFGESVEFETDGFELHLGTDLEGIHQRQEQQEQ